MNVARWPFNFEGNNTPPPPKEKTWRTRFSSAKGPRLFSPDSTTSKLFRRFKSFDNEKWNLVECGPRSDDIGGLFRSLTLWFPEWNIFLWNQHTWLYSDCKFCWIRTIGWIDIEFSIERSDEIRTKRWTAGQLSVYSSYQWPYVWHLHTSEQLMKCSNWYLLKSNGSDEAFTRILSRIAWVVAQGTTPSVGVFVNLPPNASCDRHRPKR